MSTDRRPRASSTSRRERDRRWLRPVGLAALSVFASLAAACSDSASSDDARQASAANARPAATPASPEMVRAAASLSLTGVGSLKEGSDYDRAVNCAAALGVLDQVVQPGALSEAQLRGVEQAAAHF